MASFAHLIAAFLLLLVHGSIASPVTVNANTNANAVQAVDAPIEAFAAPNGPVRRDDDAKTPIYYLYTLPRLVVYFQTTHNQQTGQPISMLPLVTKQGIALTHLIVCSFHIGVPGSSSPDLHLNDYPPSDPRFDTLWSEVAVLQAAGVRVMGMVGGAAGGSFSSNTLDSTNTATFEIAYKQLHDAIVKYGLQGMDLDVEQSMSQAGITRLVERLNKDFGPQFEVTLAPVASALTSGGPNLSGFSYPALASTISASASGRIAFYNAQFYNGFGDMSSPNDYENIVKVGSQFTPDLVLIGQITSPAEGGNYVAPGTLKKTVTALQDYYGSAHPLGGIMGWEYFDSEPGGQSQPWQWAQDMTKILRPNQTPAILISKSDAQRLTAVYSASTIKVAGGGYEPNAAVEPGVDYMAMVNV
ncbi:hypothetical protein Sste5346_007850 [Sporothrix stenoceras]|uniref:GH18 domain-containing protein n=1 Tax=Sporothrix stenoceras TaxID=5173 RepID=A0ABR3YSW3_9PEZI